MNKKTSILKIPATIQILSDRVVCGHMSLALEQTLKSGYLCLEDGASETQAPISLRSMQESLYIPPELAPYIEGYRLGPGFFRLCRVPAEKYQGMSDEERRDIVKLCLRHGIFCILEGAYAPVPESLSSWMHQRNTYVAQLSGRDQQGVFCTLLGDYANDLSAYDEGGKWRGSLGTFTVKDRKQFSQDLDFLDNDSAVGGLLPWGSHSMVRRALKSPKSLQYGPYVFGGDKSRVRAANSARRSNYGGRAFGGSTMHLDGLGSMVACGAVICGEKSVTAVEVADCIHAHRIAGFRLYAKPGGSHYLVNREIADARCKDGKPVLQAWKEAFVRYRTFRIKSGSTYIIPAGMPHEFENLAPSLSIAWNTVPKISNFRLHESWVWGIFRQAVDDAASDLGFGTNRFQSTLDHAPIAVIVANTFPEKVTVPATSHCTSCARKYCNILGLKMDGPGATYSDSDSGTGQCYNCLEVPMRWMESGKPKVKKSRRVTTAVKRRRPKLKKWTNEEESTLLTAVQNYGLCYEKIQKDMPHRTPRAIRDRLRKLAGTPCMADCDWTDVHRKWRESADRGARNEGVGREKRRRYTADIKDHAAVATQAAPSRALLEKYRQRLDFQDNKIERLSTEMRFQDNKIERLSTEMRTMREEYDCLVRRLEMQAVMMGQLRAEMNSLKARKTHEHAPPQPWALQSSSLY